MAGYKWVNKAPILLVPSKDIRRQVQQFRQNLEGWTLKKPVTPEDADLDELIDASQPPEAEAWDEKIEDVKSVLEMIEQGEFGLTYAYMLDGQPVALMVLMDNDPTYIADLVTHPGSATAGAIMIEFAVNFSEDHNHGGRLALFSLTNAVSFYKEMGFELEKPHAKNGNMTLDPKKKGDKWTPLADGWHLNRYVEQPMFLS